MDKLPATTYKLGLSVAIYVHVFNEERVGNCINLSLRLLKLNPNDSYLDLIHNNIKDISPLTKLTSLEELYIGGNDSIVDFSPLANMPNTNVFK